MSMTMLRNSEAAREMQPKRALRPRIARTYFLVMATVSLLAIALTILISVQSPSAMITPDPATNGAVMVTGQILSYFTVLSNILVAAIGFMLFRNPNRRGRVFDVVHFDALIMISVTGLVFALVLAPLVHPVGLNVFANAGLHYIAPPLFVLGWALFGPRPTFSLRLLGRSLIIPGVWIAYTLVHGAIIGWYPYPFLDVSKLGYLMVGINLVVITVASLGIGAMYLGLGSLAAKIRGRRQPNNVVSLDSSRDPQPQSLLTNVPNAPEMHRGESAIR